MAVLTAAHNQERYIAQCINSVLAQSFGNWEMIVVDDGSADQTLAIASSFADPRIKVITLRHRGIEALRETYAVGMAASTAPLLAILDGDDYWMSEKLALQVPLFDDREVVMAFGDAELVDENSMRIARGTIPRRTAGRRNGKDLVLALLHGRFMPSSVSVMVRRDAIERVGGFSQPADLPLADSPTWLNVLVNGDAVGVRHALGAYRVHGSSVCRTRSDEIAEGWMHCRETFLDEHGTSLGLDARAFARLRRDVVAMNDHNRAVLNARRGDWPRAVSHFHAAFERGGPVRRAKTVIRYALTAAARLRTRQRTARSVRT